MKNLVKVAYKPPVGGVYGLILKRLSELNGSPSGLIKFPDAMEKIGRCFCMQKEEIWACLLAFRDFGFIEIVPGHGVRLVNGDVK